VFGLGFGELIALSLIVLAAFGGTRLGALAEQRETPRRPPPPELRFVRAPRVGRWTRADWTRVILAAALGVAAMGSTLAVQRASRQRAPGPAIAPDYLQFVIKP
jgi:hypothetical protein